MTGSKLKLVFQPLPANDPSQRQPALAQAKEPLNWHRPFRFLAVRHTIAYSGQLLPVGVAGAAGRRCCHAPRRRYQAGAIGVSTRFDFLWVNALLGVFQKLVKPIISGNWPQTWCRVEPSQAKSASAVASR